MEQIEIIKKLVSTAKKNSKKDKTRSTGEVRTITGREKKSRNKTTSHNPWRCGSSGSGSMGSSSRVDLDNGRPLIIHSKESTPRDSLAVLKGMRRLQTTLQRDDLCWT